MQQTLKNLLELNIQINILLSKEETTDFSPLGELISKKDTYIQALTSFKVANPQEFNELKQSDDWKKLQNLETENLKLLQERKDNLSGEIVGVKTHIKAINSYKYKKHQEPRLFDDSY